MDFNVITGGPCSGKSTLVDLLRDEGFSVSDESARIIIQEQKFLPKPILPNTDFYGFQDLIMQRQEPMEQKLPRGSFLDRSLIDCLAYHVAFSHSPSDVLLEKVAHAVSQGRYRRIFFLEKVPYHTDGERFEDHKTAQRIHDAIKITYETFNIPIIGVPDFGCPKQRLDLVKQKIHKKPHYVSLGARVPDELL